MSVEESGALDAFDLARTFVHLGQGSTATPLPDFDVVGGARRGLPQEVRRRREEGRLVCVIAQDATWDGWERHPAGDEVVVLLTGRVDVVQDLDGADHVVELRPGDAMVNPVNVWHTARVHEPGRPSSSHRAPVPSTGRSPDRPDQRTGARSCGPCGG